MLEKAKRPLPPIEQVMMRFNAGFPLDTLETAVVLKKAPATLEKARCTGKGPRWFKDGRLARYMPSAILAYQEANSRQSTSEPGPQIRPRRRASTGAPSQAIAARSAAPHRRESTIRPKRDTGGRGRS